MAQQENHGSLPAPALDRPARVLIVVARRRRERGERSR